VPTFLYQVRDNVLAHPSDMQTMFNNILIGDEKLFWIGGTTRHWDGHTYVQRDLGQMLKLFKSHMA